MDEPGLIYIVDDDGSCRAALERLLVMAGLKVQCFASGLELLEHLRTEPAGEKSSCVLADLCMPGLDGLQLQEACINEGIGLPFVFLTAAGNVPAAVSAMRHGAVDFLDKCDPPQVLLSSLRGALANDARTRAAKALRKAIEGRFEALTAREREVLRHVVQGKMNKQIAAALGIHERTVKLHRNSITTKVGVRSVAELTALAGRGGFMDEAQQSHL